MGHSTYTPKYTLIPNGDDEFFSTGLTEDIVTHLSKIPELKVASSRSSLRYRGTEKSLQEIGRELGVTTLLVGKIRRQADQVRVNVELIDADTRQNLWADVFDGEMSDIFAIQTEIAQSLADRLEMELSPQTERQLVRSATVDPEAYEAALRGRHLRNTQEDSAGLLKAAEHFEKAVEKDPGYALAWAGLAEVYHLRGYDYAVGESRSELDQKARDAVDRALELDDGLAEAHVSKGIILAYHPPFDDAAGESELRRAIELDPRLANAHRELGLLLLRKRGRVREGRDELIVAERLEPFWVLLRAQLIEAHLESTDLVAAAETTRELRELGAGRFAPDPVIWNPVFYSSLYLDHATLLALALLKSGDADRALRLLEETEQYYADRIALGDTSIRARVGTAAVHALRGDEEAAYDWLQQAINRGFYQYAELERHPCFESLHEEERFQQMMGGVRLKVEEARRQVDAMAEEG